MVHLLKYSSLLRLDCGFEDPLYTFSLLVIAVQEPLLFCCRLRGFDPGDRSPLLLARSSMACLRIRRHPTLGSR